MRGGKLRGGELSCAAKRCGVLRGTTLRSEAARCGETRNAEPCSETLWRDARRSGGS